MSDQNFKNHGQFVPLYHYVLFAVVVATLIGSIVNLVGATGEGVYSASLLVAVSVALMLLFYFARVFALKAQDRAIRAEENLRHYVLNGSLLDSRITTRQVIGLRFAPDDEFAGLAKRAADEGLSEKDIKLAVKNWRGDDYRV